MLVLTRKSNQSIMIGDEIEVSVLSVMGEKVRIGIQAPQTGAGLPQGDLPRDPPRSRRRDASQGRPRRRRSTRSEVDESLRELGEGS